MRRRYQKRRDLTEIIRPVTNKMSHLANCCTAATSIVGLLGGKREAGEVIPSSERNFSQDVVIFL